MEGRGTVTEGLKRGACLVEPANGQRCIARALDGVRLSPGERVQLEFHPYDLFRKRIVHSGFRSTGARPFLS